MDALLGNPGSLGVICHLLHQMGDCLAARASECEENIDRLVKFAFHDVCPLDWLGKSV